MQKNHVVGSILRITLVNFLTHDHLEITPGPCLNMIIGPNGSGKSSIVAAIVVGLGEPLSLLGKVNTINRYIKYGKESSTVSITLKGRTHDTKITRIIKRKDNQSEWFLDNAKSNCQKIQEIVKINNIQLNSLCQFLPQDRVFEFSKMTAEQLLVETQKSVSGQDLADKQIELINMRNLEREKVKGYEAKKENLENIVGVIEKLKVQCEKYEEKAKHFKNIQNIKSKIPWMEYNEAKEDFKSVKEERLREMKAFIDIEDRRKKLFLESASIMEKKNHIEEERVSIEETAKKDEGKKRETSENITKAIENIRCIENEISNNEYQIKNKTKEMAEIKQSLVEIDGKLKDIKNLKGDTFDREIKDVYKKKDKLEDELEKIKKRKNIISSEGDKINIAINELSASLNDASNSFNRKIQFLRHFHRDTSIAYEWLSSNRHLFKKTVYGPVCLEINVKDQKLAPIVEGSLSKQAMTCFIMEDYQDYELFLSETNDKKKLKINAIHIKTPDASVVADKVHKPAVLDKRVKELGFDGNVIDLVEGPEFVLFTLSEQFKINLQPYTTRNKVSFKEIDSIKSIQRYFALNYSYEIKRDHKGQVNVILSRELKSPIFFIDEPNTVKGEIIKKIEDNRKILNDNSAKLKEELLAEKKLTHSLSEYNEVYFDLIGRRNKLKSEISSIESLKSLRSLNEKRLKELGERTHQMQLCENINRLKSEIKNQFVDLIRYFETNQLLESKEILETFRLTKGMVEMKLLQGDKTDLDFLILNVDSEYEKAKKHISLVETRFNETKTRAKSLLAKAREINITDELKEAFQSLPDNLSELETLLSEELTLIEFKYDINLNIVEDYRAYIKRESELRADLESIEIDLSEFRCKMEKKEELWMKDLQKIIGVINENFTNFFEKINCVGEIKLYKTEKDYDKWGIHILVKFREEEGLHLLDSERQSGGERSVSTILYLMAIQESSITPFRIVDEINQGMDDRNERLIHNLIVDIINRNDSSPQCFIITPKLLLDLEYNERTKIICIYNGANMPDKHNWFSSRACKA